jgi:hypothetical protein
MENPEIPTPVTPAAGATAESFLAQEVADAKRSLMLTRIIGAITALFVVGYLGYITSRFQDVMKPANAAEIAHGIIAERVDENANAIATEVKTRVPVLIEELPDYAIKQMPEYRQRLEDQIIGDLTGYAMENAPKLGDHLEDFLGAHQEQVKQIMEDGQDPAIIESVGAELEKEFLASLKETDAGGGETFREKMDKSLIALQEINNKMNHLAANKNLTASEKKTRRAIAILAGKIDAAAPTPATTAISERTAAMRKEAESLVTDTP